MKECFGERISRVEHYFLSHPECERLLDIDREYPKAPNGKCLCAKDAGYVDECYAGEGFFDCRDCWDTLIQEFIPQSCQQCSFFKDGVRDEYDEVCAVCTYEPSDEPYICEYKIIDGINSSEERMMWCHYNER